MKIQSRTADPHPPTTADEARRRIGSLQWATLTAFGIATALLLWRLWRYVGYIGALLPLPYSIDYGEGIVLQQAMLIPGPRMYGDINVYPYIVFHYPPLYHVTARAIAAFGVDLLYAGRWLSVASTVATAVLVGALISRLLRQRVPVAVAAIASAIGGATVFTYLPVAIWSPIMRVDMFAVALGFAGVYLAVLGVRRPALLYAAALAFALSIYTKQTMVAAPAATFGVLWLREPRSVRGPVVFGFSLAAAALAWLSWETHGGFLRHIVLYNINRFSIIQALRQLRVTSRVAGYLLVAIPFGLVQSWWRLRGPGSPAIRALVRQDYGALILAIVTAWLGIAVVITLATVGKTGGNRNYSIEWMCILSVFVGIAIGDALDAMRRRSAPAMALIVPTLLAAQMLLIRLPDTTSLTSAPTREAMDHLFRMIQAAQKPVLSDDMVLLLRAGKQVPIEPAIFAELGSLGRWDQRKLVDLINLHAFAFIVTEIGPGSELYDERYTRPVQAAIATNYPRQERFAEYVVLAP
jgi:hypothetical protein